jgi:hypothetical protein
VFRKTFAARGLVWIPVDVGGLLLDSGTRADKCLNES